MKNPGIKIPFLDVKNRPIVEGMRCVQVKIPDDDSYAAVLAGLVALGCQWFNWSRDDEKNGTLIAAQWRAAYLATEWENCMNCEELQACLAPLFDALTTQIDSLSNQVTNLQQVIDNSVQVQQPEPYELTTCTYGNVYSGALLAVEQVNLLITSIYKRAEVEAPDNLAEGTELILSAVPLFETLPFDELFSLAQWAFDNQKATYEADYVAEIDGHNWFEHAAGALWCLVKDTCEINYEIIGMWLSSLKDMFPGNYAAEVFSRFGDATTPTMVNQVGELLNELRGGQSLAAFFDDIIVQFGVGSQDTNPAYTWIDCAPNWCLSFTGADLETLFFPTGGLGEQAVWTGTGWARNDAVAPSRITIGIDLLASYNITEIRVINSVAITGGADNIKNILSYPAFATMASQPGTADTVFDFGAGTSVQVFAIDCITDIVGFTPVPGEIIEVQISGTGTGPTMATPCP